MITQIDPISTPPTPADTPADFEQKASQVWGDLFKAVPQMNEQALEIEAIGQAAVAAGQSAQADSDAALGYRNESRAARDAAQAYEAGASGSSAAAGAARAGAESAASDANDAAVRAETAAAEAQGILANAVQQTSATGAALLPEGGDAQRPTAGSIPAGHLVMRGSTQTPADYKLEFWDRVAAAWKTFADRTWVGQQIDAAVASVQTWVNGQIGFAVIYPNGGSSASPANVTSASRYVMANPFSGRSVICEAQLRSPSGNWGSTGWQTNVGTGAGVGTRAAQLDDTIVVQTGGGGIASVSPNTGGSFDSSWPTGFVTSAPCRVIVWRVKG